ncbi:MAG: UvrD-helicase domain-containing protein, partial [Actinomycetota bacterium]|nr:UvrD-helicase domain-containing protein [Actinomycetota bacterium]
MSFPAPDALGRGLVVRPGAPIPPPFAAVPKVVIDDAVLAEPAATADLLQEAWTRRQRVVVKLAVPAEALREPERCLLAPHLLDPGFTFHRERLQFLVWANTYDARGDAPVWWHGVRAARLGATHTPEGPADVVLADGRAAFCDGGPRRPVHLDPGLGGHAVVHRDSIDAGLLTAARHVAPSADLAADQLAAVAHPGGPARIIAPAGSGKTRVLTERIRHLLCDRGYEPELVTAVAYNVLAAEQLRERTEGFRPTIRTLNSLGLSVCQRQPGRRLRVAEEREQREILAGLVTTRRKVNTDPLAPYLDALSAVRLGLCTPERAERLYPDATGLAAVFPAYRERLEALDLLDFDEQIYRAVALLLTDPALRAGVRAGARTLLVDEFQDLTPAHLLLVRLVAGPAADVFGVGDDDQVIYGYAGADPGFLIDFPRFFPGAAAYDLEVNYRCPGAVVTAADHLLSHNHRRIPKTIRPNPGRGGHPSDETPLQVRLVSDTDLGPATVEVVERWRKDGVDPADIAVLTRVNSSLLAAQVLLTEAGIPCRGAVGPWLLDRAGTAAALAYLRIATNPASISRADLRATVRRPSRRISPKVLDMLARDATTSVRSIRGLASWLEDKDAFPRDPQRVHQYADDLEGLAEAARAPSATTSGLLRHVRDGIGLGEAMDTLDASKVTLDRSANGDDLAALLQVAALHPDPVTFEAWLRSVLTGSAGAKDGVHLATVHRVKGREWPCVAVFGADAGLFPHRLADDQEEERRIFHVAITRARERVVVLGDAAAPSPFLSELTTTAPPRPSASQPPATPGPRGPQAASGPDTASEASTPAQAGLDVTLAGGRQGRVSEVGRGGAVITVGASPVTVDFGTTVRIDGRPTRLVAPAARVEAARAALIAWRTTQAKAEGKPAYVYLTNASVSDIAERDPDTPARLARCTGIGPAKLEAYGEAILALLDDLVEAER